MDGFTEEPFLRRHVQMQPRLVEQENGAAVRLRGLNEERKVEREEPLEAPTALLEVDSLHPSVQPHFYSGEESLLS